MQSNFSLDRRQLCFDREIGTGFSEKLLPRPRIFGVILAYMLRSLQKLVGSERTWYSTKIPNIFQIQQQMAEIWTIFPDGSRFFWSLAGRVPEPKRVALGSCSLDGTWPRCIAICISKARFVSQLGRELRLTKVFRFYLWVTVHTR